MYKILLLIFILTSFPAYASCPIDGISNSCVAEIQPVTLPPLQSSSPLPQKQLKLFTETPSTLDISREIKPAKAREFSSNNTEYGYNSSCQFGVCMDTGTPKIFTQDKN